MSNIDKHGKKWRLRWTDEQGQRRSACFQRRNDAEKARARNQAQVDAIKRGEERRIDEAKSFADLTHHWLHVHAIDKRSLNDDRSILRAHLTPVFGNMRLMDITSEEISKYKAERTKLSSKTVHNHLTLLRAMLQVAHDLGWIYNIPRIRKPKISYCDADYSYLKDDEEIARFLKVAKESEGEEAFTLYMTATATGLREGELAGLQWADIDFAKKLITVRRSYDGPTKSGKPRHVPLLDALHPVLRGWKEKHGGIHVFLNQDGRPLQKSSRIFQEILHRVLDSAHFPRRIVGGKEKRYITFHDLRHTFASSWMRTGGDIFKLQKILGHADIKTTQRYAHLAPTAFSPDLGSFDTIYSSFMNSADLMQDTSHAPAARLHLRLARSGQQGATHGSGNEDITANTVERQLAQVIELPRRLH